MPNYNGMDDFARRFSGDARKITDAAISGVHEQVHEFVFNQAKAGTPLGSPRKSGRHMRQLWKSIPGMPVRVRPGKETSVVNVAPHAIVIGVYGRKRGKTVKRLLGSPQAPRGVVLPTLEELQLRADRLIDSVLDRFERF